MLNCSGRITEWRFNGQTVPGASGGVFTITKVDPADKGKLLNQYFQEVGTFYFLPRSVCLSVPRFVIG